MEAGEENSGNTNLKRQRAPLSDSEDNVFTSSDDNDGQKRRRLEAAGQENRSPKPSSSGRHAELETKPDTPMVPSVQSRVRQLTQRREGAAPLAQRCLSDPGAVSLSLQIHEKSFKENLLGEGEFYQRLERFKVPVFHASLGATASSTTPGPRSCSNFVSDIQQKLQGATTPSSKQAVRMRQEREQELSQLHFQPISENAWLKRSSSDPSLTQERSPPGPSYPSYWVPRSVKVFHWPPMKPWDQADGDAEIRDGSFTETISSGAKKQSSDGTGERPPCDSEDPAASAEAENSTQPQNEQMEKNVYQNQKSSKERDCMNSAGNEEQFRPQQSQTGPVLKLSFSDNQSFHIAPFGEDQNMSELQTFDDQGLLESTYSEESDKRKKLTEERRSEVFSFDEVADKDCSPNHDEGMETTDEELRLWRYPQECKEEEESILAENLEDDMFPEEKKGELESSRVEGCVAVSSEPFYIQDNECSLIHSSAALSEMQEDDKVRPESDKIESESCSCEAFEDKFKKSCEGCYEGTTTGDHLTMKKDKSETDKCSHQDDVRHQSKEIQTVNIKEEDMELDQDRGVKQRLASPGTGACLADTELESKTENVAKTNLETQSHDDDTGGGDQSVKETQESDQLSGTMGIEQGAEEDSQSVCDQAEGSEEGESSKKVTFILEPELINDSAMSEANTSMESRVETSVSDVELSSHDETNTAELIDQMFEEVLEYAGRIEEERVHHDDTEDRDSGIGTGSGDSSKIDMESEKEKSEKDGEEGEGMDQCKKFENNGDEMLTFPSSGILSPLSKSVEAVVTPLRMAVSNESNPPSLLLTPEETSTPPVESAPLYSIDAYRTQRQSKPSAIQSVTPGVQRRAPEKSRTQPSVNNKEKIVALNQEAGKLQTVISQTLQALSCCTDEEHGRGSLEEAEAEKLLLVSCEKRSALLAEMARLREERSSESGEAEVDDSEYISQQPCRGTVSITNIQLPLKVEFVCSSHNRTGRPSHYFFILIRYGPCNIVATPLATAADAQNGDTISFPTSVTLKDIRSSFEIDVEVYSLSNTSVSTSCTIDRATTKSRVTPRKLLNTITRTSNSLTTAPPLNTRRSSNFCMVGSHKITLASLGHSKFPLDKVPFLSPLEGNIYLKLDSESHSNVQHQGFLTMFELISGFGVWHRRYFVLKGWDMYYWNHPNDKETKGAEGSISLSSSHSQCVRPVKRDSCARPFTFELVSCIPEQQQQQQQQQQDNSQDSLAKCWFSADTKQERLDWMEKLNQVLLDFHTWNRSLATQTASQQANTSSSGNLRESIL